MPGWPGVGHFSVSKGASSKYRNQAATKLIWLVLRTVQARWKNPPIFWQAAKTQLAIQFEDRFVGVD